MLTYTASQLWSVLHGMNRSFCRIEASVYKTLKATEIIAVRPTHRGTKRPVKLPVPVLTNSAPRDCVYKQAGKYGRNVNNLIQIPTNGWGFPSIICANDRSVIRKIDCRDMPSGVRLSWGQCAMRLIARLIHSSSFDQVKRRGISLVLTRTTFFVYVWGQLSPQLIVSTNQRQCV